MKLIHFFIIFAVLIGASLGVPIIATKGEPSVLLYVAEGLCGVALLFLLYFYRKVMRPIKSISNGMELLIRDNVTGEYVSMMKHLNPYRTTDRSEKVLMDIPAGRHEVVLRSYNRFEDSVVAGLELSDDQRVYRKTLILPHDLFPGGVININNGRTDHAAVFVRDGGGDHVLSNLVEKPVDGSIGSRSLHQIVMNQLVEIFQMGAEGIRTGAYIQDISLFIGKDQHAGQVCGTGKLPVLIGQILLADIPLQPALKQVAGIPVFQKFGIFLMSQTEAVRQQAVVPVITVNVQTNGIYGKNQRKSHE